MFSATEGRSIAEGGYNVRKQVIANAMLENPDLGMGYFERNLETLLLLLLGFSGFSTGFSGSIGSSITTSLIYTVPIPLKKSS